jgi:hypothetical protein
MDNLAIPENITLVAMDVASLYTNIPHDDGIAACRKIWEQRTDQEPSTECLVEMLTLVLKNNNFTGGSIKEGHFGFRHFVCELNRRMNTVGMFQKCIKLFIALWRFTPSFEKTGI